MVLRLETERVQPRSL